MQDILFLLRLIERDAAEVVQNKLASYKVKVSLARIRWPGACDFEVWHLNWNKIGMLPHTCVIWFHEAIMRCLYMG